LAQTGELEHAEQLGAEEHRHAERAAGSLIPRRRRCRPYSRSDTVPHAVLRTVEITQPRSARRPAERHTDRVRYPRNRALDGGRVGEHTRDAVFGEETELCLLLL